jgi:Flp pilus assembly protein TadG
MWIQFLRDRHASVAPIFAIVLVPMLIATGAAIDYSRAFRQRTVVQDALDSAALAAAKKIGKTTDTLVKSEAQNFYSVNVGNKVDIIPTMTPSITSGTATITLTTQLHVPTYFLGLIGLHQFVYNLSAQATQGLGTIEVAMVLDNSTSMSIPNTKISTLKTAAADLATTLWGLAATSAKVDPVKIAVIPFGATVNVGSGVSWIDTQGKGYYKNPMSDSSLLGSDSNAPASFIPYSIFSTLKDSSGNNVTWAGCVETRPSPYDVSDDAPSTAVTPTTDESKTLFEPMVAPDEPDNWNCSTSSCDYLGTTSSTRRYNGAPSGSQTYNNYLPDAGDDNTCGTTQNTITITTGSPVRLNRTNHGLAAGTEITLATTGSLPSPLSSGSTYYVSAAGLSSGNFYVTSSTSGTNFTLNNGYVTLSSISNAKAAVFSASSHGLSIGDDITLATTGSLPSGLSTSTTYYVASTTTNNFTVTTASSGTTVSISRASPGVFTTSSSHGFSANDALVLSVSGGSLPSGLSTNTVYYVKTVTSSTKFTVSSTAGGTAINTTSSGSGTFKFVKVVATSSAGSGTHSYREVGTPTTFTANGHGLSVGDAIAISSSGTVPSGLSTSTIYYVASKTTNTFTLATGSSSGTQLSNIGSYTGTLSFIPLIATTSSSQSGTQSYVTNATAYTCANGDCSGSVPGQTEKKAMGGQSVASAPMCKYGTSSNKATMSNVTVSNLSGTGKGGPNYMCTTTAITPLTTTQQTVSDAITAMQANGYTNITEGLMWGWRALSPGAPFTEGRSYSTSDNKKILVLMTDGENTYNPYLQKDQNPSTSSSYAGKFVKSAYGGWSYLQMNHLGTTSTTSSDVFDKLNAKTSAACTAAKAAGITIYTVGFEINDQTSSDPATALALLEGCATDTTKYYDAQNETDLLNAFTAIGNDISQLRLSQ